MPRERVLRAGMSKAEMSAYYREALERGGGKLISLRLKPASMTTLKGYMKKRKISKTTAAINQIIQEKGQ